MATYRTDNLLELPRLTTPRSRVQFGSLERHTYTPPDYSDAIHQPRSRSPTYNRKELLELQDKISAYRDELNKKDKLIGQLTIHGSSSYGSALSSGSGILSSASGIRTTGFADVRSVDQAYASDYAATKSENARLQSQVRDLQVSLESKEDRIREMKIQLDSMRETESRQATLIHTQREKLLEYETRRGNLEGSANLHELSFQALQQEHREAQQRIIDLESRLRKYGEERERMEDLRSTTDSRWLSLVGLLRSTLPSTDIFIDSTLAPEKLSAKILEIVKENNTLRAEKLVMEHELAATLADRDNSTETVKRLLNGVETDRTLSTRQLLDLESVRLERDMAVSKLREQELEVTRLTERLAANQLTFDTMKAELESRLGHERELEGKEVLVRTTEGAYKHFKETLASMLSSSLGHVEPYEEAIREQVKNIMQTLRDKTISIDNMEKRIATLSQQLEVQYEQQRNADKRAKKAEADLMDAEDRLRRSHTLPGSSGVSITGDRDRFIRFVDRAMRTLGMEPARGEMGLESACDAILERIERQARLSDIDDVHGSSGRAGSLQRKISSLQEQLTNKDLHLDLLRKKVNQLEQRFGERALIDADSALMQQGHSLDLVSKYKRELSEAQLEIHNLRTRLAEYQSLRANRLDDESAIQHLETKVDQLENVRHKQAQRIEALKSTVADKVSAANEKKAMAQEGLHTLSNEVRNLKVALRDLRQKERKLLELRQLVAKMLGLDVNLVSVADFEIISRLEKVILAAQSGVAANTPSSVLFEVPTNSMSYEFRSGYDGATRAIDYVAPRSRSPGRRSPERQRSPSPSRHDTRTY